MSRAPVKRDRFNASMGEIENCPARRLVHSTRFHADEAVFNQIEAADTIVSGSELIELCQKLGGESFSPSMATGSPFSKSMVM